MAEEVERILSAPDFYAVLGVAQSTDDEAIIRKAYLKLSIIVHPDKNKHALATEAFQRVAEGW